MRHRGLGLVLACAVLATAPVRAQSGFTQDPTKVEGGHYELDPAHGKITWSVSHLGFSTYTGQFTGVEAKLHLEPKTPTESRLEVTVQTDSVGTLNPELDKHLKSAEFFDVARFPTATFRAAKIVLTGARTGTITGDLTLHGVTKPVTLTASFNQAGTFPMDKAYRVGFSGQATIKRSEFGMTTFVPMLGDDVALEIEGEFKKVE